MAVVAVLAAGVGLFYNGYGPMALKDRDTPQLSAREAKAQLDDTLRTAMGAISPPVAYFGGFYAVDRRRDHADGEPSLLSDVRAVVSLRTKVAPARIPVLLDQMKQLWGERCRPEDHTLDYSAKHYTDLSCPGHEGTSFTLSVVSSENEPSVEVYLRAEVSSPVRYQPENDYGTGPTGKRLGSRQPQDLDDPYWSH
ncbi:hypothetical protein [Kitasatospora aureofaciens]|uniref:hypothetical protein n=1 Tax=Kitasatospora aureofaciens TaxID=1894 RepID=UPI001C447BE1|nr:hypothetical protein [Kitasatospora aureofaciens]MBV6701091.1 hypothetical protein [Kitasatospora aureofaciens]